MRSSRVGDLVAPNAVGDRLHVAVEKQVPRALDGDPVVDQSGPLEVEGGGEPSQRQRQRDIADGLDGGLDIGLGVADLSL
jgi:hypothetical protein